MIIPLLINLIVSVSSKPRCHDSANDLPPQGIGLIPGTRRIRKNGRPNLYYQYRIEGAVRLYNSGKLTKIIVSGHTEKRPDGLYDEPGEMFQDLISLGIPPGIITKDPSGSRTIDSIRNACDIISKAQEAKQKDGPPVIIISQEFHNQRALALSSRLGLDAYGYNVQDVPHRSGLKTRIREIFARIRMVWDLIC